MGVGFDRRDVSIGDRDFHTARTKGSHNCRPYTARRAGHQRYFTLHHSLPFLHEQQFSRSCIVVSTQTLASHQKTSSFD
jgi:hypothetical protein